MLEMWGRYVGRLLGRPKVFGQIDAPIYLPNAQDMRVIDHLKDSAIDHQCWPPLFCVDTHAVP